MKTLKDLTEELLGVRLNATNISLWQLSATLTEAARAAVNEALRTYEFTVRRVYTSISLPLEGATIAVLPRDVHRIIDVFATGVTSAGPRRRLEGYTHQPTTDTNLLYFNTRTYLGARNVEVDYESRLTDVPRQAVVAGMFTSGQLAVHTSGAVPAAEWRAPGYFAIHPALPPGTTTTQRELIRYEAVTATSFTGLTRAATGAFTVQAQNWSQGDLITPVLEVPDQALPVLFHAAQAEMYHFWVRDRALYEQFTAIASLQNLDLGDLLGLIRSEEDRADRRWDKVRRPPTPTHAQRKRRRS